MSKKFNASSIVILIAALCSCAAGVVFQSVGGVFGLMKYNYYNPVIAWSLMGVVAVAVVLMLTGTVWPSRPVNCQPVRRSVF